MVGANRHNKAFRDNVEIIQSYYNNSLDVFTINNNNNEFNQVSVIDVNKHNNEKFNVKLFCTGSKFQKNETLICYKNFLKKFYSETKNYRFLDIPMQINTDKGMLQFICKMLYVGDSTIIPKISIKNDGSEKCIYFDSINIMTCLTKIINYNNNYNNGAVFGTVNAINIGIDNNNNESSYGDNNNNNDVNKNNNQVINTVPTPISNSVSNPVSNSVSNPVSNLVSNFVPVSFSNDVTIPSVPVSGSHLIANL